MNACNAAGAGSGPSASQSTTGDAGLLACQNVADVMVRRPKVLHASATLQDVRSLLADDHVHMALLTDGHHHLAGTLTRDDLPPAIAHLGCPDTPEPRGESPALPWARLSGRTVPAAASAVATLEAMTNRDQRRLAVIDEDGMLLGLVCLKASHSGFCSDHDVAARAMATSRLTRTVETHPQSASGPTESP